MFDDILPMLTLAVGGALAAGTIGAFIKPRDEKVDGELERPPLLRSIIQVAIGLTATVWALATLFGQ